MENGSENSGNQFRDGDDLFLMFMMLLYDEERAQKDELDEEEDAKEIDEEGDQEVDFEDSDDEGD